VADRLPVPTLMIEPVAEAVNVALVLPNAGSNEVPLAEAE